MTNEQTKEPTKKQTKEPVINFYRLDRIKKENADINIIYGERSNGKTYSCLEEILTNYLKKGEQGAIIRRWADDFKKQRGQQMFDGLLSNGILNGTHWDGIEFKSGMWFLTKWDDEEEKKIIDTRPFCYSFALATMEHDKSTSYSGVKTILFDEFLTRNAYLPDEFVLFMNTLSTIIRYRDDVKIYMCANTVSKDSIYWKEMGLQSVVKMKIGELQVYRYGESKLTVAVEYCENAAKDGKPSDKYFAFNNPKLNMITGGAWEMAIYPHLPMKYKPKDVKFTYFIKWEDEILQCEIINIDKVSFTFIHPKTTPLQNEDKDLIFSPDSDPRRNWRRRISQPTDERGKKIWQYFLEDKVYYLDNETGEIVRNYLQFCARFTIIKS